MKLGVLTHYSKNILDFVSETGYETVSLSAGPGSPLDATKLSETQIAEIKKDVADRGLEISAIGFYPDHLRGYYKAAADQVTPKVIEVNPERKEEISNYFMELLNLANKLDVDIVCTHVGSLPGNDVNEMLKAHEEVFTPYVQRAESLGIKIAIENCPHGPGIANFAHSPAIWDKLFEIIPSKNLGIEMDPSHMAWLFLDYIKAIRDYGDRMFHVHLKDTEIRYDMLGRSGIRGDQAWGSPDRWWSYRVPGWGMIDWKEFFTAFYDIGFKGAMVLEQEDRLLDGTDIAWMDPENLSPNTKLAYKISYDFLKPHFMDI